MRPSRFTLLYTGLVGMLCWQSIAFSQTTLNGVCQVPQVIGQPQHGYISMYEWNIFLNKMGADTDGQSYRVGSPAPNNYYQFSVPTSGIYSLYLTKQVFWGRPKIIPDISIPSSGSMTVNVSPEIDYSVAFGENSGPWGDSPWTPWHSTWYQSFIATGTSITGINFKLAGTNAGRMHVAIVKDNGGAITTWPTVGSVGYVPNLGAGGDQWVRFLSGDIPTNPGDRYALKLTGEAGSPNNEFAVYRRNEDGTGYTSGQAYDSAGSPHSFDLYAIIFTDKDNTLVSYTPRVHERGTGADWQWLWSQSVKAKGTSVAGVTMYFAADTWDHDLMFAIRKGSVDGTQVGPKKTGAGAYETPNTGFAAVSWQPGEVPLTPGETYFIEITGGLTATVFTSSYNSYPDGQAYEYYAPRPSMDLHLQVVEYGSSEPPTIARQPSQLNPVAVIGQPAPQSNFDVSNSGSGLLEYTITDNANWLSVAPSSGTCYTETDTITVNYDPTGLSIGTYNATITISDPNATNNPQTIAISLEVQAPAYAPCDFEPDGDVDQADFGHFQLCYTTSTTPQTDPACEGADLNNDTYVDQSDFALFMDCLSGESVPADTLCAVQ